MSVAFKGTHWSKLPEPQRSEVIARIAAKKLGSKHSEETKQKMSLAKKGKTPANWQYVNGSTRKGTGKWFTCPGCSNRFQKNWDTSGGTKYCSRDCWLDQPNPQAGVPRPWQQGDKHFNWKGGITPKNLSIRGSLEYRIWRKSVFERDSYTCQDCGARGNKLHAHHMELFSKKPELRFEVSNGKTLCVGCHRNFHKKVNT